MFLISLIEKLCKYNLLKWDLLVEMAESAQKNDKIERKVIDSKDR